MAPSFLFINVLLYVLINAEPDTLKLELIDNNAYPHSICNDGTSAGYYYSLSEISSKYWIIHLEGGHWCWDINSCNERNTSSPELMSNKYWEDNIKRSGMFDNNATLNPILYNANKIYIPYCSSDAHMGNMAASEDTGGYAFMGQEIIISVIDTVHKKYGFGNSNDDILIFSGCSAGGRGAMVNLDYIPGILTNIGVNIKHIMGVLDSPLWINIAPENDTIIPVAYQTEHVYTFANVSGRVIGSKCGEVYTGNDSWKCLFGEYKLPLLQLPHVINAAQYDAWQLSWDEDNIEPWTYSTAQIDYANNPFRSTMRDVILANITNNILSTACFHHCVVEEFEYWNITIYSIDKSFRDVVITFINDVISNNTCTSNIDCNNDINNKFIGNCTNGINCGLGCNPEDTPY